MIQNGGIDMVIVRATRPTKQNLLRFPHAGAPGIIDCMSVNMEPEREGKKNDELGKNFKDSVEAVLTAVLETGNAAVTAEINPALDGVELSQDSLLKELRMLHAEMDRISTNIGKIGVDELTLRRLKEAKESLARTKKTLLKVHGRLGKLRTYEESHRLHRTDTEMVEKSS